MYQHTEPTEVSTGIWKYLITAFTGGCISNCTCYFIGTRVEAREKASKAVKRLNEQYSGGKAYRRAPSLSPYAGRRRDL